uniref:Chemerin chemokine-like receptor 1 n=1 Tax=Astyanax mexicanus TaxID=7994 RepID=A0A8B9JJL4_ASTMX
MNSTPNITSPVTPTPCIREPMCMFYVVANVIIIILGVAGNGLVIWIAGFKVKKSVNSTWYLSLALSDLLFCLILPFFVGEKIQKQWNFGLFMCKFRSFVMFLNWFSSIYLLVIIAVDRCVVVVFPVWAQNRRTIGKASVIVVLAWIVSAALSTPMAVFREVEYGKRNKCIRNYTADKDSIGTVSARFLYGFAIPLLIIIVCYLIIIRKLVTNEIAKTKKPLKVMSALIVTFFICWMPFHIFSFLEINYKTMQFVKDWKSFTMTIANTNSFLNPFLYAFMGKDIKNQCHALLSKIQNAIEEDSQPKSQGTSHTTSSVAKHSTAF